jgi:hypothetical protein
MFYGRFFAVPDATISVTKVVSLEELIEGLSAGLRGRAGSTTVNRTVRSMSPSPGRKVQKMQVIGQTKQGME